MEAMDTAEVEQDEISAATKSLRDPGARASGEAPGFFGPGLAGPGPAGPGLAGAALGRVIAWDLALLRAFASLRLPKAVTWSLILLVRIGDGWLWVGISALLFFALPLAELKEIVAHCLVAIAVSLAFYWPIKFSVRRLRPHESGMGVTAKVPPLDKFSFPSGHTMNNLAVALTLSLYVPNTLALAWILPLFLGTLRIFFGVHWLSDIGGGAFLGALSFFLAQAFFPFLWG